MVTDTVKNVPQRLLLQETLKSLAKASNSLKLNQDKEGNLNILGVPVISVSGDKIQIYDKIYEFTPEIHKALSQTSYTGKSMKIENDQKLYTIS